MRTITTLAVFMASGILQVQAQPAHPTATHAAASATEVQLQQRKATAHALVAFHLDAASLASGATKAIVDNRVEPVGVDNFLDTVDRKAVFVSRVGTSATAFTLPAELRSSLPAAAKPTAVQLSYAITASAGASGGAIRLVAVIANNTGLLFNASQSVFRGEFWVALSNAEDPSDRRALAAPITVMIAAPGASEVTPKPLVIGDVGNWHTVALTVPNPNPIPYRVGVSADPQDKGDSIDLAVLRPSAQLIPASRHVIGWGIGEVSIAVRAQGSPGLRVLLETDHGSLSPSSLALDSQGIGTTSLRSDAAPSTVVRVGDASVTAEPVTITFDPPWLFLLAAVLGGLIGAFIRGKGRQRWSYAALIGIASAILMTLAYAVGIDWATKVLGATQLASSGEAVVFVLGAVAALVGVSALIRTAK